MIHTKTPTTSVRLDCNRSVFYVSALNKINKARAYQLTELSAYGAEIEIILDNDEREPLTKKKLRWSEICFYLFNVDSMREPNRVKAIKAELEKHGLIIIKD